MNTTEAVFRKAKRAYKENDQAQLVGIAAVLERQEPYDSDYVPYPDHDDREFNRKIAHKHEFAKSKQKKSTESYDTQAEQMCSQKRFSLTNNQKFLKHFMSPLTPYNSLLIFHQVGAGKSCTAISIAEQFAPYFKKRVLMLASANLEANFRKQIFDIDKVVAVNGGYSGTTNQCTGSTYLNQIPDRDILTRETLDNKIRKVINERYEFKGYMAFANEYDRLQKSMKTPEKFDAALRSLYSDRVIIIDEAHNLRLDSDSSKKQVPKKIDHVLGVAQNTKLIMLTATPMFNMATEIVWLLNYALVNDKQPRLKRDMLFNGEGTLTKTGKSELIRASRGRVSFMRGDNPYSFPFRLYPSINEDKRVLREEDRPTTDIFGKRIEYEKGNKGFEALQLVKSYITSAQLPAYEIVEATWKQDVEDSEVERKPNEDDDSVSKSPDGQDKKTSDIAVGRQVSNIVYPGFKPEVHKLNHASGREGFNRCFNVKESGNAFSVSYKHADFGEFLAFDDKSSICAPKLKAIVDYILKSEGVVFVYSEFVWSGVLALALALEHQGFSRFNKDNLLTGAKNINKQKKKMSYILVSGNKRLSPDNDNDIKAVKRSNNKDGSKIKVILVTNVATEGIDFKYIREIHVLEPWYHLNKIEQVVGRGVRNCSHALLDKDKRNTTIFLHANTRKNASRETIDVRIYRIAYEKQRKIQMVESVLINNSIDCWLNKSIMYFSRDDVDHTITMRTSQKKLIQGYRIGDTEDRGVSCYPRGDMVNKGAQTNTNTSTFRLEFMNDDVDVYTAIIVPMFAQQVAHTYESIEKRVKEVKGSIDEDVLKYSLDRLVSARYVVHDPNSKQGVVIYRSNKYMFQPVDKTSTRLTLEERTHADYATPRKRVAVDRGGVKVDPKTSVHVPTSAKSAVDVYRFVADETKRVGNLFENPENYANAVLDFVVDRLPQQTLHALLSDIHTTNKWDALREGVKRSLADARVLLVRNAAADLYIDIYGGPENRYFIFENKKLVPCPPMQMHRAEAFDKGSETLVGERYEKGIAQLRAFLTVSKNGLDTTFKTFTAGNGTTTTGSVCKDNSKLKGAAIKELIADLGADVFKPGNQKKADLCVMYELALRIHRPELFARPHIYNLLSKKMK
jgi:Type III restriction enzyme, res subunit/Helicase conserved C-terminal domain